MKNPTAAVRNVGAALNFLNNGEERRNLLLRALRVREDEARTPAEACLIAAEALRAAPLDVPFALIYLIDSDGHARAAAASGLQLGADISPIAVDLAQADEGWPLAQALQRNALQLVEPLFPRFATVPAGPWLRHPDQAVVVPIPSGSAGIPDAVLVAGLSARRRLDASYREFFESVAMRIGNSIRSAHAREKKRLHGEGFAPESPLYGLAAPHVLQSLRPPLETPLARQKKALELAIGGAPVHDALNVIVQTVRDQISTDSKAAIFITDAAAARLRFCVAVGLNEEYARAVDGFPICPQSPSCGQAAYTGEAVVVREVAEDALWAPYLSLARKFGIRACWSFPVRSYDGQVIGTLAVYHPTPREPDPRCMELMELLAQTASLIIERHKGAEERARLEAHRQLFVSLAENSHEFIGMCDRDLKPFFVNKEGMRMVGLDSLEQAMTTPVREFFFPEDQAMIVKDFFPKILRDGHGEVEVRFRHFKTGAAVWMIYAVFSLADSTGEAIGYATVSRDITERKRIEQALQRSEEHLRLTLTASERQAEKLKEADRKKDEFLATLAHELRNPLAPLRTGLQLLKVAGNNADIADKTRVMMERQLGHMVRLIDDLLDVSRISRGTMALQISRMELATAVNHAIETSQPVIDALEHQLSIIMPSEPVYIRGDEIRLSQIIGNLLNNAAKYTRKGGKIRLEAQVTDKEVAICVEDSGIGISAEMLPKIFDMFTQADQSLEKAQGGLGIGLTLVRRLVALHGGSVEAASEGYRRGSRFTVRLPIDLANPDTLPDGDKTLPTSCVCGPSHCSHTTLHHTSLNNTVLSKAVAHANQNTSELRAE